MRRAGAWSSARSYGTHPPRHTSRRNKFAPVLDRLVGTYRLASGDMNRTRLITIVGIAVFAAFLVAFGPAPEKEGNENVLRLAATSPPDSLDSAVSYQAASWNLQVNVYNGLLTYKKVSGND